MVSLSRHILFHSCPSEPCLLSCKEEPNIHLPASQGVEARTQRSHTLSPIYFLKVGSALGLAIRSTPTSPQLGSEQEASIQQSPPVVPNTDGA